jgi:hypothetical protein
MLGKLDLPEQIDNPSLPLVQQESYSPLSMPVTTNVASAMTLATSMLLLQSLTSAPYQPQGQKEINTGVLLFAGLFATGFFIYEQITDTYVKGKKND